MTQDYCIWQVSGGGRRSGDTLLQELYYLLGYFQCRAFKTTLIMEARHQVMHNSHSNYSNLLSTKIRAHIEQPYTVDHRDLEL